MNFLAKIGVTLISFALISACTNTANNNSAPQVSNGPELASKPEFDNSSSIKLVDKAIPHENYEQWLSEIQKTDNTERYSRRFQAMFDRQTLNQSLKNTESHWIEYQVDGLKISGVIAYPKNHNGKKLPVVIYNRGGNMKHNVSRITLAKRLLPIAEQGYLVLASNYRGSRYSEGKDEFGGADVNDVLRLIDIAKTLPNADAEKIALFGWSRGGMMTWQALREKSQDISAAIIGAGVSDAFKSIERRPEMGRLMAHMIPQFDVNKDAELTKRSAIFWVDEIDKKVPVLLLHGDRDTRVDVSQATEIADKLTELNYPHELVVYPGDNHGLAFHDSDVQQKVLGWLQEHLK